MASCPTLRGGRQACDDDWRARIFPPAVLLAVLAMLPLGLLLAFAAARQWHQLCRAQQHEAPSGVLAALVTILFPVTRGYRPDHAAW